MMTLKKVLILVGLPGSGKSKFATDLLLSEPGQWVRTNKDLLREMAHASLWTPEHEIFIEKMRNQIILMALQDGKNVIIDDTNFGDSLTQIQELVRGKAFIEINDSFLQVPLEECIRRDLKRFHSVGKDVILKMYNTYVKIPPSSPPYRPELPDAIIVDLDGTLSLLNVRNPYDTSTCDQDLPNLPVLETVLKWQNSLKIIIISGRMNHHQELTEQWLKKYGINDAEIYLRKPDDLRQDRIIKEEIYHQFIQPLYNIRFVIDDRQQVVEMWRNLGLTVFQVAEGNY